MSKAIYVGILLIVGGALLEGGAPGSEEGSPEEGVSETSVLGGIARPTRLTRTTLLLQALGTVLLIIGVLALLL